MVENQKDKKFKIVSLGCRTNQYEAQAFRDQLQALGYVPAEEGEEAGVCIVNTCTVTESADASSRHAIRQLAKENKESRLLVTGCFAQRDPQSVKAIEGVTAVVPNSQKEKLLEALGIDQALPEFSICHFEAHTRAFVKVQDGCNSFCTYCIIPYVRGRSQSRSVDSILKEVETLVSNGYKEIVLTGINIGDFDGGVAHPPDAVRLAQLVRLVDQVPGVERLRLSSIDPDEVDEELAEAVLNGRHTCPSMHIVLQSGSNVILKRMNRKYTRQIFLSTVDRLKAAHPDFTFTTDIIVGFPGETDQDFQETLEVMRQVNFAKVHMFPYSDRARTRASLMPHKISEEVKRERKQAVLHLSEQLAFELRNQFLGRSMMVLTEKREEDSHEYISGHTSNFLPVLIKEPHLSANQLVEVVLEANTAKGLIGRVCS